MLKQISLKSKLLLPIFGLFAILVFFGLSIITYKYSEIMSLKRLYNKVVLSNYVSETLHSFQKERGLSSGYTTGEDKEYYKDLRLQREISDKRIRKLLLNFKTSVNSTFQKDNRILIDRVLKIQGTRKYIDEKKITGTEVIRLYSELNNALLDIILNITKNSYVPEITQNFSAYSNFLYYKEHLSIERAKGVYILSSSSLKTDDYINFLNLLFLIENKKIMFLKYASKDIKAYYTLHIDNPTFKKVKKLEEFITDKKKISDYSYTSKQWYNTITKKLNILDGVSKYIQSNTIEVIKKELRNAKAIFVFIIFLVLMSLIAFILILIAFLRLLSQEQRLRTVIDKYIIYSTTDTKGIITDVSKAFCKISGFKRFELIGKPHNIIRHPDMPKEVFWQLWSKLKNNQSWSGKVKNRKKDTGFYWVYANIEPLYNSNGEVDAYISVRLDITENEQLTEKILAEQEKSKINKELAQQQHRLAQMGEMISMIAHQWRQPLSAITASAGSLSLKAKRNKLDAPKAIMIASEIQNLSLHLSSTIDDFRNFFKSDKLETETNFQRILDSVCLIIENSLKDSNIKIIKEIYSVDKFITYENELKQVVLNLIKNAEDAIVENNINNGTIIITIDKNTLSVSDNAGGIDDTILNKIFDPYFSTKMEKDGTGLGLYMSKIIIQEHCKGTLSVKNSNNGAIFSITLGNNND